MQINTLSSPQRKTTGIRQTAAELIPPHMKPLREGSCCDMLDVVKETKYTEW